MPMNLAHRRLCASAKWSRKMRHRVADRLDGFDLGADPLEIGPGFGATTRALLREHARALTALEIDPASARQLQEEFGDRARIVRGDGVDMPFDDDTFSAVVCFTMLHHVPSVAAQDAMLAEARRVLRPGGLLLGTDSQTSLRFRLLHVGDTMNVLDPVVLPERLRRAGFEHPEVDHVPKQLVRFTATKPA